MNKKTLCLILSILIFLTTATAVLAIENFQTKTNLLGTYLFMGLGFDVSSQASVSSIVGRYIAIALSFLGAIFLILAVYAGFLWMSAGGNKEQIEKAKKILVRAVIGLVIVLSAYAITWVAIQLIGPKTIIGEEKVYF